MKLSIIIPAYNEEKTILQIIDKVKSQDVFNLNKEIIVIDDGSRDSTYSILKKIKGIVLLQHKKNKGKGFAIRTGLEKSTGEIILIQDADLELTPEDYPTLVRPILENKSKVVYGSRILGNPNLQHNPLYYFGGRLVTFVANLLYGINITDEPIGYKVFKAEVIKSLNLECERFEFCPEVTAKIAKRNIKIIEVPVQYFPRTTKEGKKLGIKDGVEAILTLIKYKFKR
jgi:glycosyltransferase involved in cell wall biosynthesis